MVQQTSISIKDFERFVALPENAGRLFELIHGEVREVSPGRTRYSEYSYLIAIAAHQFCRERNLPYHVTGGQGAFQILGNVVAPDFAYKPTPMSDEYPDPVAPSWVVEIISPTDKAADIRAKRQIYLEAGILYWEIYPESPSIDVYASGKPVRTLGIDDVLDGGDVLPGFTLPVRDIFSK